MFVCVARLTLQIPESGSLKAKRQVLRRITDRVKARFNVSVAEVEDQDLWQKSKLALAVVGNERSHVKQQMDRILHFIDEMYVAPIIARETETLSFGDGLFTDAPDSAEGEGEFAIPSEQRSLAEAEGLGEWRGRQDTRPARPVTAKRQQKLTLDEARAKARSLRNPREWEKK